MKLGMSGRGRIHRNTLPNCTSAPQVTLSQPPVSLAEIQLVSSAPGMSAHSFGPVFPLDINRNM